MSYKVLGPEQLRAMAPPGAPDDDQELAAALDEMELKGWRLAGVVNEPDLRFVFHSDAVRGRMGNMR